MAHETAVYDSEKAKLESQRSWSYSKRYVIASQKTRSGYLPLKRTLDIALSIIALVFLSPLLLITAIAVKLEDGGPVIYSQTRIGKDNKDFRFYKFRSMCVDAEKKLDRLKNLNESDGPVFKISADPRVTKVGKIIRKYSIDELPQLINIIKGDMSIVGPRPPLPNEVTQYTPEQMRRLNVKPGLTCYWQISGRSDLSFQKWMELDLKYIRECSLWTDFKIVLKTVPAVLTGRGAY